MAEEMEAGLAALRSGDPGRARPLLERAAGSGGGVQALLLLAQCCSRLGDGSGEEQALDRALELEPRNLMALLAKGELMRRRGEDRAAVSFFGMALRSAPDQPPPALQPLLQRAAQAVAAAESRFHDHLEEQLRAAGVGERDRPPRFSEALDIMAGRKPIQMQQPTSFFYPGLPPITFYDPSDFPWAAEMERRAPAMRSELEAILEEDAGFHPYVQGDTSRANRGHALLNDARWSAFDLWEAGQPVEANARRCPQTMAALELAPVPVIRGRSPMALFSLLKPRTHIPPHWGMINTRLICHVPLIVPPGCRLRVGNDTRAVEEGRLMIFDDSINHEAWNDSDDTRVVLLFEIWRPEIGEEERHALTAMFEAIGSYEASEASALSR